MESNYNQNDAAELQNQVEQQRIKQEIDKLRLEIARLRAAIVFPSAVRGMVSGVVLGNHYIGGLGAIIGGFLGHKLSAGKELSDTDKQILRQQLYQKQNRLRELITGKKIREAASSGVMSAADLGAFEYETIPFQAPFSEFFGLPSKNFHCMVYGLPKQGKSIFSVQFSNYFAAHHGKVLYIAAEEGFSKTLQQKLLDFGMTANPNMYFADFRDYEQIREHLSSNNYDMVVLDSVNFIRIEPSDVEVLKQENPETAFVTIQQATKDGKFRGSQEFAHNCDIIVQVHKGIAKQQGRFNAEAYLQIFEPGAPGTGAQQNSKEKSPGVQGSLFTEESTEMDSQDFTELQM